MSSSGRPFIEQQSDSAGQYQSGGMRSRYDREACAHLERLLDPLQLRRQQTRTIAADEPEIERPAIVEWRHQPARIDDRIDSEVRLRDGRPVAVRQVDVAEGKRARYEARIGRIELALDPVGPDPVQVGLDRPRVQQAARMKTDARAQQLDRFGDIGRLREPPHAREEAHGIDESVAMGCTLQQQPPR
ncbi:MAG: hypothetical protein U5K76_03055 [Woeseiaceae bacterium]|nr:hypothetical protein [Woeseiaceae bacterium]